MTAAFTESLSHSCAIKHALQGWCPPLPILRRLGFRTTQESEQERAALRSQQDLAMREAPVA